MDIKSEKAIINDLFDCNEKRKFEGANIRSYLLEYKDVINPEYFIPQLIQDINYLDYNLKNENSMLNQLVDKLENFNREKYPKKWINDQLDDTAKRLVEANHFSEYLESVKSSLNLSKEVIDQSAVAKYDEYKFQIDQTRERLFEINITIDNISEESANIKKDIERLKKDETIDLQADSSNTFHFSEETQKKIDQLKNDNELFKNSEKKTNHVSSRRHVLLHDFNYIKNEEIINEEIKTKLNSLVSFFEINVDIERFVKSFSLETLNNLNVTKTIETLIRENKMNETTVNLFIVILEEDYDKISLNFEKIIQRIRHELNVYLICRSSIINLIKLPSNRGTLKIKRETTDNHTEWAKIVLSKINQQEKVDEAKSNIPMLKRDSNTITIKRLESVKDDQLTREAEEEQLNKKRENDRLKQRELVLEGLQSRKKEIESELDYMVNVKSDKENSLKEKQKLLDSLEHERNAVLEKLKAGFDREKTIDPRLYQLESKLNSSIDYLRILCQRRELILNYIGKIKNFIEDQYSNEGFQNQTIFPSYISNIIFGFLRLKPFSE